MTDIKAREAALEIIAILTGYRQGKPDPDHNKFHTLHSIAAGESTVAAIDLAMTIARPIQRAIEEALAESTMPPPIPKDQIPTCTHFYLDMDGICKSCGKDCRGLG